MRNWRRSSAAGGTIKTLLHRSVRQLKACLESAISRRSRQQRVTVHVASQPMVLTVEPNSILFFFTLSMGPVGGAQCAVSGVQQTLG